MQLLISVLYTTAMVGEAPGEGGCHSAQAHTTHCATATATGLNVSATTHPRLTNITCRLDLLERNERISRLAERSRDGRRSLGLTLCADDGCLALLLGLLDDKLGALGVLLGDLLLLDGGGELLAEAGVSGDLVFRSKSAVNSRHVGLGSALLKR